MPELPTKHSLTLDMYPRIGNGAIVDENGEDQRSGKKMSADAVGETYLFLHNQSPCLWTSELDMRPACEKF